MYSYTYIYTYLHMRVCFFLNQAQRDGAKVEKKELLKEEKKQLKALAKLKDDVEEGVRSEKARAVYMYMCVCVCVYEC